MLDEAQNPTFLLKMRDGEHWKFEISNRAMQAVEESVQAGEATTMHMVFCMSIDYRLSVGLAGKNGVTFEQFRDRLLPSVRTLAYRRFRDSLMAALNDDSGNEALEPAIVEAEPAEKS